MKQNVVILPLNVRKESVLALSSGNLDEAIAVLENTTSDLIPVEDFGFAYDSRSAEAKSFLEWIVSEGQSYNHDKGFLQLTSAEVALQLNAFHGSISGSQFATNIAKR